MKTAVTGATGFVGRQLVARLERPVVFSRDAERAARALGDVEAVAWDPASGQMPPQALDGVDCVFHLAGEPLGTGRWDREKKARIRDSRVRGTRALVEALRACRIRPRCLVSVSAVGYYGDGGDEMLDERAPPGSDFLAEVCRDWEAEAARAGELGIRVVNPRFGLVLGEQGGALAKLSALFATGLGGRLGSGRQWMPWIHVEDVVDILLAAANDDRLVGPVNTVAPGLVTNRDFTSALASMLHRPAILPVPAFALRLALGGFADVLLASQRVVPTVLTGVGHAFRYPLLIDALQASLRTSKRSSAPSKEGPP